MYLRIIIMGNHSETIYGEIIVIVLPNRDNNEE